MIWKMWTYINGEISFFFFFFTNSVSLNPSAIDAYKTVANEKKKKESRIIHTLTFAEPCGFLSAPKREKRMKITAREMYSGMAIFMNN